MEKERGKEGAEKPKGEKPRRRPRRKMCDRWGKYPADEPSSLCVGCDAYREHTGWF